LTQAAEKTVVAGKSRTIHRRDNGVGTASGCHIGSGGDVSGVNGRDKGWLIIINSGHYNFAVPCLTGMRPARVRVKYFSRQPKPKPGNGNRTILLAAGAVM
jgi:hypothetical protein